MKSLLNHEQINLFTVISHHLAIKNINRRYLPANIHLVYNPLYPTF